MGNKYFTAVKEIMQEFSENKDIATRYAEVGGAIGAVIGTLAATAVGIETLGHFSTIDQGDDSAAIGTMMCIAGFGGAIVGAVTGKWSNSVIGVGAGFVTLPAIVGGGIGGVAGYLVGGAVGSVAKYLPARPNGNVPIDVPQTLDC